MKIASIADLKARLSSYLKLSEEGPVVVTRSGKPVAVLLDIQDEDELERLVTAYSPQLQGSLETAREHIREGHGIPHKEFWEDVESES